MTTRRFYVLIAAALTIYASSIVLWIHPPDMMNDSHTYVAAMEVMQGREGGPNFLPVRLITSVGYLGLIVAFSKVFGSIFTAWVFLNIILLVVGLMFWYDLLWRMTRSRRAAAVGLALTAFNYAINTFGLNWLMDGAGWSLLFVGLWFTYAYLEHGRKRDLWIAAVIAGIGAVFKETAALGFFVLATTHLWMHRRQPWPAVRDLAIAGTIAIIPSALAMWHVWAEYQYTYLDWRRNNAGSYAETRTPLEWAKVMGSLFGFAWFLALASLPGYVRALRRGLESPTTVFPLLTLIGVLPSATWPYVGQRVMYVLLLPVIMIIALWIKDRPRLALWCLALSVPLCAVPAALMDSHILPMFDLDDVLDRVRQLLRG